MGIFSRLSDIINSNLNALLDRAEDPEKLVRLIIQEMEDTLVEVRSTAVKTIAERKEILRRIDSFVADRDDWARKAELAIEKGREDLAKGALHARARAAEMVTDLERQLGLVDGAVAKTGEDIARLQAKLDEAKNREKALRARHDAAASRLKVRTQLHDSRIDDAFERFSAVERKLDELEGKVEVHDLGRSKSLAEEFAELEADDAVERELAELKARMAARQGGTNQAH
jgi:phage shock protein A